MFGSRNLYVYTPGFPRRQGRPKLLNMLVLGEFPEYQMIVEEGSVNMVHKRYRQYLVRLGLQYNGATSHKVFYSKQEATEYIKYCSVKYSSALIEYVSTDWKNVLINYGWHKHFCYSKVHPVTKPIRDSQDLLEQHVDHPLEQYLYNEYDTLSRIDDDAGIEWSVSGGIEGEENEDENGEDTENYDIATNDDIIKMLAQFN